MKKLPHEDQQAAMEVEAANKPSWLEEQMEIIETLNYNSGGHGLFTYFELIASTIICSLPKTSVLFSAAAGAGIAVGVMNSDKDVAWDPLGRNGGVAVMIPESVLTEEAKREARLSNPNHVESDGTIKSWPLVIKVSAGERRLKVNFVEQAEGPRDDMLFVPEFDSLIEPIAPGSKPSSLDHN